MPLVPATTLTPPQPGHRWDLATSALLFALLAFAPFALGGVEPWSRLTLQAGAAALSACLALKLTFCRRAHFVWSRLYVPMLLFIAFVALQAVPLPAALVGRVSPQTASLKAELTADIPRVDTSPAPVALSFYPYATRHDLRLVLAASAVFVVVLNAFQTSEQIVRLLRAVAVIGGAVAAVALAQDCLGGTRIFGFVRLEGRANGGPFVNHSHFAQFMNLSIGAALGLLLARWGMGPEARRAPGPRRGDRRWKTIAVESGWLMLLCVSGAVSITLSLSRGGMLGMLAAACATGASLALAGRAGGGRGALLPVLVLLSFACVLYLGFDRVFDRFATPQDIDAYGGRGQILKDLTLLYRRFPWVGTGLGTHAVIFPVVDRSVVGRAAAFAENDYAQLLEEVGLVGAALAASFLASLIVCWFRCARSAPSITRVAFGLGYGLIAVMVQSVSDFGQHIPANAILSATICALLVALARIAAAPRTRVAGPPQVELDPRATPRSRERYPAIAFAFSIVGSLSLTLPGAWSAYVGDQHAARATRQADALQRDKWHGSREAYEELIGEAWLASDSEPGNVLYRYRLDEYRWRALGDQAGGTAASDATVGYARRIVADLQQARVICPTFGSALALAGQLEWYVLGDPAGVEHVRAGYRLSPQDATTAFATAQMEAGLQNWDASVRAMRRAVALEGALFAEALAFYLDARDRPDVALDLAGGSAGSLLQFADGLDRRSVRPDLSALARARAFALLQGRYAASALSGGELVLFAELCEARGEPYRAIEAYRRALAFDYNSADLHLRLARSLRAAGQVHGAQQEARICLRLSARDQRAAALLKELSAAGPASGPTSVPAP